jgi:hypothetical protein
LPAFVTIAGLLALGALADAEGFTAAWAGATVAAAEPFKLWAVFGVAVLALEWL